MADVKRDPEHPPQSRCKHKYWWLGLIVCLAGAAWFVWVRWPNDATPDDHRTVRTGQGAIHSICLTPDGEKLLVGGHDGTIQIRSFPDAELLSSFKAHDKDVMHIAVSSDGSTAYSASADDDWRIRAWDLKTQKLAAELHLDGTPGALAVHPHRRLVAVENQRMLLPPPIGYNALEKAIRAMVFTHNMYVVRLWDLDNGGKVVALAHTLIGNGVFAFSADGQLLAFSEEVEFEENVWSTVIRLWEVDNARERTGLRVGTGSSAGLQFLGDTHTLAVSGLAYYRGKGPIEIWDTERRELRTALGAKDDHLQKSVATKDGRTIVGGLIDTVRVWDVSTGTVINEFAAPGQGLRSMAMTKNGEWLAIAHGDRAEDYSSGHAKITIWRLK